MLRRGLLVEYSYSIKDSFYLKMCISFLFFFFLQKVGTLFQITHQSAYIFLKFFFFFDRRIYDSLRCSRPTHSSKPFVQSVYIEGLERQRRRLICESVNIFSLMLSRLQGYPSIEHLYLADSSLARVFSQKHLSIYDFVFRNFVFF